MGFLENGSSLSDDQMKKIEEIIDATLSKNSLRLNRILDIPLENPDIFWATVDEVQDRIDYSHEELRPYIRIMPPELDKLGMIRVFLANKISKDRDIQFIIFTKIEFNHLIMFLGSILDTSMLPFYNKLE